MIEWGNASSEGAGHRPQWQAQAGAGCAHQPAWLHPPHSAVVTFAAAAAAGDTYRGRWHESDVAVKCINPLMVRGLGQHLRLPGRLACWPGGCHGWMLAGGGTAAVKRGERWPGCPNTSLHLAPASALPRPAPTRTALRCTALQIGVQYASRQAWVDFLRDANQMGKLRHPNLAEVPSTTRGGGWGWVGGWWCHLPRRAITLCACCPRPPQVYGVVLPHDSDPRLAAPRSRSEPQPHPHPQHAQHGVQHKQWQEGQPDPSAAREPRPQQLQAAAPMLQQDHEPLSAAGGGSGDGGGGLVPSPESSSPRAALLLRREVTLPAVAGTLPQELPGPVANPPAIVMEYVGGKSLG